MVIFILREIILLMVSFSGRKEKQERFTAEWSSFHLLKTSRSCKLAILEFSLIIDGAKLYDLSFHDQLKIKSLEFKFLNSLFRIEIKFLLWNIEKALSRDLSPQQASPRKMRFF